MTSYSSDQFSKDWRFAIQKDFVKHDGTPFDYAKNGLQEWGQELLKIPFDPTSRPISARCAAISDDLKYIAICDKLDIIVTEFDNPKKSYILRGHISDVDGIRFRPGASTQLVSSAQMNTYGAKKAESQIILWDLTTYEPNPLTSPKAIEGLSRNAANSIIAEVKSSGLLDVNAGDQKDLADAIAEPISRLVISRSASKLQRMAGRLLLHFQSQIISPSGKFLTYVPGTRPFSPEPRQLRLYSMDDHEDVMEFDGFNDSIMWTGFNRRETLLAGACWDGTFRVWEVKTGVLKHMWVTGLQNWTGAFSPDDRMFAGTSGDGNLHVYDLTDGSEHLNISVGQAWSRSLSWHPNSNLIALGGEYLGRVHIINITTKTAGQVRLLSMEDTRASDQIKEIAARFLVANYVQYVDGGRKLALFTGGDGSAEVYDMKDCVKWRFARTGTMNSPDDDSEVTSKGGYSLVVREDPANKRIILASIDHDAVRVWAVPTKS